MARFALLVTALLTTLTLSAGDKAPDPHFLAPRTSALAHKSVFIHGYLHGYEQGFHLADLDLQLNRGARDVSKNKQARDGFAFRSEFGDRHAFELGYSEGLRSGYADGIAGRTYRALNELGGMDDVAQGEADLRPDPAFDQGFSEGYASGKHQGLQDSGQHTFSPAAAAPCPVSTPAGNVAQSFCFAYVRGYRVGYDDAATNLPAPVVAQAEVRGGSK